MTLFHQTLSIHFASIANSFLLNLSFKVHDLNLLEIQPNRIFIALETEYSMFMASEGLPAESTLIFSLGPFNYAFYVVVVTTASLKSTPTAKTDGT